MPVTLIKKKMKKEIFSFNFSEHVQHDRIFWKIKELNVTNYKHKLNANRNGASKLLKLHFYLR